jgi:hypothetical protein
MSGPKAVDVRTPPAYAVNFAASNAALGSARLGLAGSFTTRTKADDDVS